MCRKGHNYLLQSDGMLMLKNHTGTFDHELPNWTGIFCTVRRVSYIQCSVWDHNRHGTTFTHHTNRHSTVTGGLVTRQVSGPGASHAVCHGAGAGRMPRRLALLFSTTRQWYDTWQSTLQTSRLSAATHANTAGDWHHLLRTKLIKLSVQRLQQRTIARQYLSHCGAFDCWNVTRRLPFPSSPLRHI